MRLTMIIATLGAGGAERVMSLLANHWAQKGWELTLLTLERADSDFFSLDNRINRVGLDLMKASSGPVSAIASNLNRVRGLRRSIRESRPDLVLSFMDRTNVLSLLACRGLSIPVVVSERSNPYHHPAGAVFAWLRKKLYPKAAAVVVNCPEAQEYLAAWAAPERLHYVPNPLVIDEDIPPETATQPEQPDRPDRHSIIGLGRFTREKGFDLLLKAFARAAPQHPAWRLFLLGQGPEAPALKEQAQRLGIGLRTVFCGQVHNPQAYLQKAGLFVLPSRYEGFPNGLAEAMACGLACAATFCSQPVKDMLPDEAGPFITPVDDVQALARSMSVLMSDDRLRRMQGEMNRRATRRFLLPRVAARWEALFKSLLA